jgi:iron complex outermembrane receptor protein
MIFGGGYNKYEGNHFGKVIWARYASTSEKQDRYYDDYASKNDGNICESHYQIANKLSFLVICS